MEKQNRVQWVYSSRDNKELTERYDQWARDYDSDLEEDFEYRGPRIASEFFARYVAPGAAILDAGAGTGLVGELLTQLGYSDLVAMDLSPGMLEEAGKKKVYKELRQMVMGDTLDFATDSFDAVISVGVLTQGHACVPTYTRAMGSRKSRWPWKQPAGGSWWKQVRSSRCYPRESLTYTTRSGYTRLLLSIG
jgi:SAM-dependent methyltransferase